MADQVGMYYLYRIVLDKLFNSSLNYCAESKDHIVFDKNKLYFVWITDYKPIFKGIDYLSIEDQVVLAI